MTNETWNDPDLKRGTMVRGALWLVQEIGLGNTFTKDDIRRAFPGIAQADRRIRELRSFGWVLHTRSDDASLALEQNRFVSEGTAVWDARERRAASSVSTTVSNKSRNEVMTRDGYVCTVCGISGGEEYPDDPMQTAVLSVSRRQTRLPGGTTRTDLVTECKRCRAGGGRRECDAVDVLSTAHGLSSADTDRLIEWIRNGQRGVSELERAWSAYLRLSPEAQEAVRTRLDVSSIEPS